MIAAWRKQAVEGLAGVFSGKAEATEGTREGEIDKLHAKVGQLVVERNFKCYSLELRNRPWRAH